MADPFLLRLAGQEKNKGFLFFSDTLGNQVVVFSTIYAPKLETQVMVSTLEMKRETDKAGKRIDILNWGKPVQRSNSISLG